MWTEDALKKKDFAMNIRGIDPFMHTIEEIRQHIIEAVEEEVKTDMETLRR
jgi:uncharacterized protein YktB (UPF0637 family)